MRLLLSYILLCSICIASFLCPKESAAQQPLPYFSTATDLEQHVSAQAYDLEVDTNGYVFMAGPVGVLFFNGSRMSSPTIEDGRAQITYVAIHKMHGGALWFSALSGGLFFLRNDSLVEFPLPDSIRNMTRAGVESAYYDSEGTLHLAPRTCGY